MNKWLLRLRQYIHIHRLLWTQIIYYVLFCVASFSGWALSRSLRGGKREQKSKSKRRRKWKHAQTQRTEALGNIITCNITLRQQQQQRKIHCNPQWIINCIRFRGGRCDAQCIIWYLSPFQRAEVNDYSVYTLHIYLYIENEAVQHWHLLYFGIEALNLILRYVRLCRMEVIGGEYARRPDKATI